MKTYKIYFASGKEITVGASYIQYLHEANINKNMLVFYNDKDEVIGAFDLDKVLGDMVMNPNDEDEQKESKPIGFQAPETPEEKEPEVKEKPKKKAPKKKGENG